MRLWTVRSRYLDAKGLVAAWREALLARAVLRGKTKGYRHHPQLIRFQAQKNPVAAVAAFLAGLEMEARKRGYRFDANKISRPRFRGQMTETRGQLRYEWEHLKAKLRRRDVQKFRQFEKLAEPEPHPLFRLVPGEVRTWEKR